MRISFGVPGDKDNESNKQQGDLNKPSSTSRKNAGKTKQLSTLLCK
jgi:hypothetical protein